MTAHARSLPALLALLTATATHARADAPTDPVPWEDCDACSQRDWVLAEPGTGPEIGPLARLELGTAGLGVDDGAGGQAVTAGIARLRLAVGLGRSFGVRASATVQALTPTRASFPFAVGADGGGAVALGVTQVLATVPTGGIPIALTLDGELADGPAVRSGLGLRTLDVGRRVTVAPGLATAWDFDVGAARAHGRYLRTRDGRHDTGAIELGVGAAMRINWARDFWGGAWPLEAWVDVRHRRGTGGSDARETEVSGGLDYTPGRWVDRVGVTVAGTDDRLDDGRTVHGLAMLVTLQYGRAQ